MKLPLLLCTLQLCVISLHAAQYLTVNQVLDNSTVKALRATHTHPDRHTNSLDGLIRYTNQLEKVIGIAAKKNTARCDKNFYALFAACIQKKSKKMRSLDPRGELYRYYLAKAHNFDRDGE